MSITDENRWDIIPLSHKPAAYGCKGRNGYFEAHEAVVWSRGSRDYDPVSLIELDIRGVRGVSNIIAFFSPNEADSIAALLMQAAMVCRQAAPAS